MTRDNLIATVKAMVRNDVAVPVDLLAELHLTGVELDRIFEDTNLGYEIIETKDINSFDEVE